MAVQVPDELAADLAELSAVDWHRVWRGLMGGDPGQWCAQFGWQLELVDRGGDLHARLPSGGAIHVLQDRTMPYPYPVKWVGSDLWNATAESPADNQELFAAADALWPAYLSAGRRALGEPLVLTAWDDPGFPQSARWPDREKRMRQRSPFRLASWSVPGAVVELAISPSIGTSADSQPGRIFLSLDVRPDS